MLKNYFKLSVRNLWRNKGYTLINIMGLTLGIACAILIFSLITYHLSFNNFHADPNRVYRIVTEQHRDVVSYTSAVPSPLGKSFREEFTFGEKVARIVHQGDFLVSFKTATGIQKFMEEDGVAFTETEFFDIFNLPMLQGDKKTVLTEPNTAIITEQIAKKYFGNENPINKTIKIDNRIDLRITGILKNIPVNSDIQCGIFASYSTLKQYNSWLGSDDAWGGIQGGTFCFVKLKPNINPKQVEAALPVFVKKYRPNSKNVHHYKLQPLAEMHFDGRYGGTMEKRNLWVLSFIGLFLVVSACVNFVNLATAQAVKRSKEVGVRKVLGSNRMQLFWQFIVETGAITACAIIAGVLIAYLLLPAVNTLFQSQVSINLFTDWRLLLFIPLLGIVITFFAGFYPALILSGFKPILALKSKALQNNSGSINIRRGLIITQFGISQVLIIGTIVIAMQMKFAQQSDLGFNKDAIVMIPKPNNLEQAKTVKNQFKQIAGVENVSLCFASPSANNTWSTTVNYDNRAEDEIFRTSIKAADADYVKTFDLRLVTGRNILESDTTKEMLVNETFVKKLNLPSPEQVLGKSIRFNGDQKGTIVGVVKDFHDLSFHEDINAVCITTMGQQYYEYAVKINTANVPATLAALGKIWSAANPDQIYEHQFLDEHIAEFYETESQVLSLVKVFSLIAIFIGCLGLYGLVSFMVAQKTKEIGIRKVLGGSLAHILWLFGKEFSRLILIAFLIAAPLGWWVMNNWLQDFKFQIRIGVWVFLAAISITAVISLVTVGYRALRAALANPVKSLRSE